MNKKTKYEIRNDQYPERKNRKKGLVILLAVLLFTSSVGGAAVYSGIGAELWNGFASNEEDIDVNELSLVAKPETEEEGKEIADTSVPLASSLTEDETDLTPEGDPTPAGDSAQAGDSTPTRDLDADELTEELDELTTVMQAMVAAPAIPTVIVTTTTGGEESTTSSESDSTTETSTTTSKSDPAAEEAARKAIEEVARQAAAKLEEAKKIQIEINSLKSQLEGAKQTTLEKQKALENARIQYQNEIAAANKALAAAQDKALAFYNMKFEGLMTLYNLSRDSNSKVSEYFEKNSEISAAIDSEGFNYGKVITEDGTKKGSKSTTVAGASNGVTSNGDGGLNKVVNAPADVATTTIATPEEIAAALPPANNLLQTATQQIGEPQPAGDPQPAANQQPAGDSQPAANQQAEGSQSEATTPTGDTKGNDESQPSEDAGSQNKEDSQNGTEDSESTGE